MFCCDDINHCSKIQQKDDEDERDERQEQSPDGTPIAVSRQLLNGNDSQQHGHKMEARLCLKTEAQQRGNEGVDEDHVGNIDHRHEALRKTKVGYGRTAAEEQP